MEENSTLLDNFKRLCTINDIGTAEYTKFQKLLLDGDSLEIAEFMTQYGSIIDLGILCQKTIGTIHCILNSFTDKSNIINLFSSPGYFGKSHINYYLAMSETDSEGWTPFQRVIELGYVETVKKLLNNGISPWTGSNNQIQVYDSKYPLHIAIKVENEELIRLFTNVCINYEGKTKTINIKIKIVDSWKIILISVIRYSIYRKLWDGCLIFLYELASIKPISNIIETLSIVDENSGGNNHYITIINQIMQCLRYFDTGGVRSYLNCKSEPPCIIMYNQNCNNHIELPSDDPMTGHRYKNRFTDNPIRLNVMLKRENK